MIGDDAASETGGATIGLTGMTVFNTIGRAMGNTSGDATMAMGDVSGATMGTMGNKTTGAIDETAGTIGAVT